jgi:hypothetical protein
MIKLGSTFLNTLGLQISKPPSGLFDFPKLKNEGTEWNDRDYNEALGRDIYYQYESRQITLDCFVASDNWASLQNSLNNIAVALKYDGLQLLKLTNYSNRGYVVRLKKTTIFQPKRYFEAGKSVASFKIVFEEPQPFNAQFSIVRLNDGATATNAAITISDTLKSFSFGSDDQKYITVYFMGNSTVVNLEQEDYVDDGLKVFAPYVPEPVVILGEIDSMTEVRVTVDPELTLIGTDTINYFLRNGRMF